MTDYGQIIHSTKLSILWTLLYNLHYINVGYFQKGADIHQKDLNNMSPVDLACVLGPSPVLSLFISQGLCRL